MADNETFRLLGGLRWKEELFLAYEVVFGVHATRHLSGHAYLEPNQAIWTLLLVPSWADLGAKWLPKWPQNLSNL